MTKQKKQPNELVIKIKPSLMGNILILISRYILPDEIPYVSAPAMIPKEGYRFAGYRYESFKELCATPVYDMSGTILFPMAAVYRKAE